MNHPMKLLTRAVNRYAATPPPNDEAAIHVSDLLTPCGGWLPSLAEALAAGDHDRAHRCIGLAWSSLSRLWEIEHEGQALGVDPKAKRALAIVSAALTCLAQIWLEVEVAAAEKTDADGWGPGDESKREAINHGAWERRAIARDRARKAKERDDERKGRMRRQKTCCRCGKVVVGRDVVARNLRPECPIHGKEASRREDELFGRDEA